MGKRVSKCLRQNAYEQKGPFGQCKTPRGYHVVRVALLLIGIRTYNIPRYSIFVINKSVCQSGSIWHESCLNPICADAVPLKWIPAEMGKHIAIGLGSCNCSGQQYKGDPEQLGPLKKLKCDALIATGLAYQ
jgi:hypothetical protein